MILDIFCKQKHDKKIKENLRKLNYILEQTKDKPIGPYSTKCEYCGLIIKNTSYKKRHGEKCWANYNTQEKEVNKLTLEISINLYLYK